VENYAYVVENNKIQVELGKVEQVQVEPVFLEQFQH
jgi:hypothetical protein